MLLPRSASWRLQALVALNCPPIRPARPSAPPAPPRSMLSRVTQRDPIAYLGVAAAATATESAAGGIKGPEPEE